MSDSTIKLSRIFKPTQCLSPETLYQYISGELPRTQIHEVEIHLTDCPFCMNLVDEREEMGNNEFELSLARINDRIENYIAEEKKQHPFPNHRKRSSWQWKIFYSFAATLLVAVALSVSLMPPSSSRIIRKSVEAYQPIVVRAENPAEMYAVQEAADLIARGEIEQADSALLGFSGEFAGLQRGVLHLIRENYELAEAQFCALSGSVEYGFVEFHLALSRLGMGQKAQAESLLSAIAAEEGHDFAARAAVVLQKIK